MIYWGEFFPASVLVSKAMSFAEWFAELDAFLLSHQSVWRPRPFVENPPPWCRQYPDLAQWLMQQPLALANVFQDKPCGLQQAPAPFSDWASSVEKLAYVQAYPKNTLSIPKDLAVDIPGRKWQQIQDVASALRFNLPTAHWLDWCAGKGHLGRLLAHSTQLPLTCLEYSEALVESGAQLSKKNGVQAEHLQQDVMLSTVLEHVQAKHTPVALHACGALHIQFLKVAVHNNCTQLALSPCCYNRIDQEVYQPLSKQAQCSDLRLDVNDLGLPLTETVTAGQRVQKQRDQSMAWRLGFDVLQRKLRQTDTYLPMPSVSPTWLKKTFAQYCQDLGALRGLEIPEPQNWEALEQRGWQRLAEVRNLELVRALFRRPLELWLVLDQVLWLEEQGYSVRLGTFCAAEVTPRNLLILAERLTPSESP